jgi:hypothetical protein
MPLVDVFRQTRNLFGENDTELPSIRDKINSFLETSQSLPNNREHGWHVSSFCDACARSMVLERIRNISSKDPVDPKLQRIFDIGTNTHRWYQEKYFGPMGILWGKWACSRCGEVLWGLMPKSPHRCAPVLSTRRCKIECDLNDIGSYNSKKVDARGGCLHCGWWGSWEFQEIPFRLFLDGLDLPILGHTDGLLLLGRTWVVLEIKTINSFGFGYLNGPRPGHVYQGFVYGELIRRKNIPGLPDGVNVPIPTKVLVLYVEKNTSSEKEYLVDLNKEVGSKILRRPLFVEECIEDKRLPPKHKDCPNMSSKRAKKCNIRRLCFGRKKR